MRDTNLESRLGAVDARLGRWRAPIESQLFVGDGTWVSWAASGVACVVLVVLLWVVAGVPGVASALATVAVWFWLGAPYGIATGTVLLSAVTGDGAAFQTAVPEEGTTVVLAGVAFLGLVLAPVVVAPGRGRNVLVAVAVTAGFGGGTWLLATTLSLWLASVGVLVAFAVVAYGLYRYHLLILGLLDPS